jgi:dipeptidyl aminopeptidase/acylaminoacyl peptidase
VSDQTSEIYIWSPEGGPPAKVAEASGIDWWGSLFVVFPGLDWLPDGASLVVSERLGPTSGISRFDTATGERSWIIPPRSDWGVFGGLSVSAKSELLLLTALRGATTLRRMRLPDGSVEVVRTIAAPAAPVALASGYAYLGEKAPNAGETRQIVWKPAWWRPERFLVPDGLSPRLDLAGGPSGELLFSRIQPHTRLRTYDAKTGAVGEPFCGADSLDRMFRRSPDGRHWAFVSDRDGHHNVWICDAMENKPNRLTNLPGLFAWAPERSPDGRSVVFEVAEEGGRNAYVATFPDGETRRLTNGEGSYAEPIWSADGSRIFVRSLPKGPADDSVFYSLSADGSGLRREFAGRFAHLHPLPGGQFLARLGGDWVELTHEGRIIRTLVKGPSERIALLTPEKVYFDRKEGPGSTGVFALHSVRRDTGEVERISPPIPASMGIAGFENGKVWFLSNDGRSGDIYRVWP